VADDVDDESLPDFSLADFSPPDFDESEEDDAAAVPLPFDEAEDGPLPRLSVR
jgi:hypothetical protein